jgi:prepilin signal peptidase PulO-like enzyme (type II secretory pathway)
MLDNLAAAVLGWTAGLLINYFSDVLPIYRSLKKPVCTHCGHAISHRHYWLWPRACPHCGTARVRRTWVVQLLSVAMAIWFWNSPDLQMRLGLYWGAVVLVYFAVIVVIDMEWKLILHVTSKFGVLLALVIGWSMNGLQTTLIGGALGYGIMFLFYWMGMLFMRVVNRRSASKSDEVALGYGDVNLAGVLGLMLGLPQILIALVLALLLGGILSGAIMLGMAALRRYRSMMAIPYGPFLVLGAMFVLYFPAITQQIFVGLSPYL